MRVLQGVLGLGVSIAMAGKWGGFCLAGGPKVQPPLGTRPQPVWTSMWRGWVEERKEDVGVTSKALPPLT